MYLENEQSIQILNLLLPVFQPDPIQLHRIDWYDRYSCKIQNHYLL